MDKDKKSYKVTDWNLQTAVRFVNSVNKARSAHTRSRPINTTHVAEFLEETAKQAKELAELEGRFDQYNDQRFQFLRRKFFRIRDNLNSAVGVLRSAYSSPPDPNGAKTSRSMLPRDLLDFHNHCSALTVDYSARKISTVTEDIVLYDQGSDTEVHLGKFEISIKWDSSPEKNAYEWLRAKALNPNPASGRDEVTHPHVEEDHICLGDADATVHDAFREGRLLDIFEVIMNLLKTYNEESPYVELADWTESRATCSCCGERRSSMTECNKCSYEVCDSCSSDCEGCGCGMCRSCLSDCRVCCERFCSDCLTKTRYSPTRVRGNVCHTCSKLCDCGSRFVPAAWGLPAQSLTCLDCTKAAQEKEQEQSDTAPVSGAAPPSPETRELNEHSHTVGTIGADAAPGSVNITTGVERGDPLIELVFEDEFDRDAELDLDELDDEPDDFDEPADILADEPVDLASLFEDRDSDDSDGEPEEDDPERSGPTGWLDSPSAVSGGLAPVGAADAPASADGEAERLFAAISQVLP